jgi:hypothetical protein
MTIKPNDKFYDFIEFAYKCDKVCSKTKVTKRDFFTVLNYNNNNLQYTNGIVYVKMMNFDKTDFENNKNYTFKKDGKNFLVFESETEIQYPDVNKIMPMSQGYENYIITGAEYFNFYLRELYNITKHCINTDYLEVIYDFKKELEIGIYEESMHKPMVFKDKEYYILLACMNPLELGHTKIE